ncbi:MAG: hypothetical protein LBN08_00080 [Lactobacillales bacterium]|jgi:hypothetical protein|nr:hypothetical protein [Lactobacillales bacterium]
MTAGDITHEKVSHDTGTILLTAEQWEVECEHGTRVFADKKSAEKFVELNGHRNRNKHLDGPIMKWLRSFWK